MGIRREPAYMLFGHGIDRYTWRGVRLFMLTYFGAFLAAAILGPLAYAWIHSLPPPADPDALLAYLQSKPLDRYVDRFRLLGVAVSLILLVRWCGLFGRFGFYWSRNGWRALWRYFVFGLLSMGLVVAGQLLVLDYTLVEPLRVSRLLETAVAGVIGGLLIGWLEEAIFRGMVFRMFYTATRPLAAILLSSLLFAAVHFKDVPESLADPVRWYSGFLVAGFQSVSVLFSVAPLDFLNLVLVGVILVLVFLRTGSLVGCMGLHAGWVAVRNFVNDLVVIPAGPATRFWGTQRVVDGYASLIILAIIAIGLYVEYRAHSQRGQLSMGGLS